MRVEYIYLTRRILSFVIGWWICTQSWKHNLHTVSPTLGLGVTYLSRFPDIVNVDPLITGIEIYVTQTCTRVTTSTLGCVSAIASVTMIDERVQRCSKMPVVIISHVMTSSILVRLPFSSHCSRLWAGQLLITCASIPKECSSVTSENKVEHLSNLQTG